MAKDTIEINRAPVLTLWAAVVAERLGFDPKPVADNQSPETGGCP
jgi:hypothetical protein